MSLRAVIFDFDGLIVDTELAEFAAWCEAYESHGCVLDRDLWSLGIGTRDAFDPYRHLETLSGVPIDRDLIRAEVRLRNRAILAEMALRDGVEARLEEAQGLGLRIGMASSSDRWWIDEHFERFGLLDRFESIRCVTDGLAAKPAPAIYLAVLADLGCKPDEVVAFEDSPNGIAAAKAAGMACIAVPNSMTASLDLSAADAIVPSLAAVSLTDLRAGWAAINSSDGAVLPYWAASGYLR